MIVGGYTLDLYCEVCNRLEQVIGQRGGECRAQARKYGWLLDLESQRCWCRECQKIKGGG